MSHMFRTKSLRRSPHRKHFRPRLEPLESRQMLAVGLDTGFGVDGLVTTDFTDGGNEEGRAIEVQEDGLLVVAGVSGAIRTSSDAPDVGGSKGGSKGGGSGMGEPDEPLIPDFALARYDEWGVLDPGFGDPVDPLYPDLGQSGKTVTDFGTPELPTYDEANGMLLLSDGSILLVGCTRTALDAPADFALAKYTSEGVLDTSFGVNGTGLVTTDLGGDDVARKVAIQGSNLIVIGSTVDPEGDTSNDFAVVRYDMSGNQDMNFAVDPVTLVGGAAIIDFYEGKDEAVDVLITDDSKIVVVGHIKDDSRVEPQVFGGPLDHGLLRLTSDGQLDTDAATGFGFDVLDPIDGTTVIAKTGMVSYDLLEQLSPDLLPEYSTDEAWAATLDASGNIVVSGRYGAKGVSDFSVVRYTPDGMLDTTFGMPDPDDPTIDTGIRHTDIANGPDSCYDVEIMPSGDIIVPGRYTANDKFAFAMVRYTSDGDVGEVWASDFFYEGPDQASVVAITSPSTVVLAGWASMPGTMVDFGLQGLDFNAVGSAASISAVPESPTKGGGRGGKAQTSDATLLMEADSAALPALATDAVLAELDDEMALEPPGWRTSPANRPVTHGGFLDAPWGPWKNPHDVPKPWEGDWTPGKQNGADDELVLAIDAAFRA